MTTLTNLAARLAGTMPAVEGKPTSEQYKQAIKDAVAEFGRRVPRRLVGALSIVAGTASYALPDGFQKMIRVQMPAVGDAFYDGTGSLVVLPDGFMQDYTIDGGQITFTPTPTYTGSRAITYMAGYPYVSGTDVFTSLTEEYEAVTLLKAAAMVSGMLAASAAGGFDYQIGDVRVNKSVVGQSYGQQAADFNRQYDEAVRAIVGQVGMTAHYAGWGR